MSLPSCPHDADGVGSRDSTGDLPAGPDDEPVGAPDWDDSDRTEYDAGGFADRTVLDGDGMTRGGRFVDAGLERTEPSEPGLDPVRTRAGPTPGDFDPAATLDDRPGASLGSGPEASSGPDGSQSGGPQLGGPTRVMRAEDWAAVSTTQDERVDDDAPTDPPAGRPSVPLRKVRIRERNRVRSEAELPSRGTGDRLQVLPSERPDRRSSQVRVISEDAASAKASGRAVLGRLKLEVDEPDLDARVDSDPPHGPNAPLILPSPDPAPEPRRARPRMSTLNRLMHLAQRSVGRSSAQGPDGLKIYRAVEATESAARIIPLLLGAMLLLFTLWIAAALQRPGSHQQPHVELSILGAAAQTPQEGSATQFARLVIETEPAGLLVVLDDEILGKTPFDAMLNLPDTDSVGVRLHGPFFQTWVGELQREEDGSYALTARLTKN